MSKQRKGSILEDAEGRLYARVNFTDEGGHRRELRRRAANKTEANRILKRLLRDLEDRGDKAPAGDRMTLGELADYYESRYLIPAEYVDGRKVRGRRSLVGIKAQVLAMRERFGRRRIRSITHGDLESYRAARLATPTRAGRQRSIATVNRELALFRRMLNVAQREGWIARNPFNAGDPLIKIADEHKRERILTREEEDRLLDACVASRAHLRPIVVTALDTGCRKGELLKLRWSDVDFAERLITVRAFNTKTQRERHVAMTARVERALWELYQSSPMKAETLVFGILDNVKKSFTSVCRAAGVAGLRFHDLRHTAATRLVSGNVPLQEVGRILGHTQAQTTYRYVNASAETARRAAAALDRFHAEGDSTSLEMVN